MATLAGTPLFLSTPAMSELCPARGRLQSSLLPRRRAGEGGGGAGDRCGLAGPRSSSAVKPGGHRGEAGGAASPSAGLCQRAGPQEAEGGQRNRSGQ